MILLLLSKQLRFQVTIGVVLITLLFASPGWTQPAWMIPKPNETDLARYLRVALYNGIRSDFDTAIINYERALKVAKVQCDQNYARALLKVAENGKRASKQLGDDPQAGRVLAQGFAWGRVEATQSLPCADKRGIWKGLRQDSDSDEL